MLGLGWILVIVYVGRGKGGKDLVVVEVRVRVVIVGGRRFLRYMKEEYVLHIGVQSAPTLVHFLLIYTTAGMSLGHY